MNTQETIIQLKELKLKGMANTLESLMTLPVQSRPSFDFAIAKMVEAEILERKERKTEMFLKTSKLRYSAMIEDVACGAERNITTEQLAALADCSFIRRHENLLIQGKCGCGKTFLACAIGRQACTSWPGNVRELQNMVRRSVAISESPVLDCFGIGQSTGEIKSSEPDKAAKKELEKKRIINVIEECNGNISHASQILGISRTSIYKKIK